MGKVIPFKQPKVVADESLTTARALVLACVQEGKHPLGPEIATHCGGSSNQEARPKTLEKLDQIRRLVDQGRISEFIFIGRDPETRLFLTELALDQSAPTEVFAFVGVMNAVQLELTEQSQLAPALMLDGSVQETLPQERTQK